MPYKQPTQKPTQPTIEVPSLYGSHRSMIDQDYDVTGWVVLRDEKGTYITSTDRLDTGLADPRRYSNRVNKTPNVKAVIKR